MTDISYIKWATFSVGTDISLSGLQTIIDSDTSLNVHLKTTNTQNYNIQPTTTGANYMVYRLKKSWVNDYSYNDNSTHDLDNTDWEQITNDASMLVPYEAYWLKYKLCENTNSGTVPSTNFALRNNNGTLELWWGGDKPSGWSNVYLSTINMNLDTSFTYLETEPANSIFSGYSKDNLYADGSVKSNYIAGPINNLSELTLVDTWMPFLTGGGITTSSQFLDNPSTFYATDVIICNNSIQSSGVIQTATIGGSNPLDLGINP